MSLHHLAQTLKNQGRGKDSELVHMTKGEVAGLHALARAHGGSLTTNPHTGLPEAGLLDTILSVGGGFLGGMFGGPLGAAIGSGLGSYIGGASPQQALMSGVMGYGLSGLGEGIEAIGQNVNQTALTNEVARQAAEQGIAPNEIASEMAAGWKPDLTNFSSSSDLVSGIKKVTDSPQSAWDFAKGNLKYLGAAGLGAAGLMAPKPAGVAALTPQTGYAPTYGYNAPKQIVDPVTGQVRIVSPSYTQGTPFPYTYYAAGGGTVPTGFKKPNKPLGVNEPNEPNGPVKGFSAGGPYGSAGPIYGIAGPIYAGDSSLSSKSGPYQSSDAYSGVRQQMDKMSPAKLKILAENATDPIVMAAAQDELYSRANAAPSGYIDKPTIQAAEGGTIKMADGGLPGFLGLLAQSGVFDSAIQNKPVQYSYDPKDQHYTQLAQGGIASLGEYAAGGKLLQGPGDGMSDSIPAVIKGPKPQRAALAQGEFVIPADVVSHLGNGSTDAGAKRLYSMMDKIRMARTGTKKQGRQINPEKFMPA